VKKTPVLLGAVMAAGLAASAHAGAGVTQSEFLKIGLSARAAGMAGAFGAIADDLGAFEYNMAGLGLLANSQVSFMYSRWLADVNFGSVAGAHLVPFLGTVGGAVSFLDVGDIEGTSVPTFKASSMLVRLAWARTLMENFTVGAGAKILNEKISDFNSSGGTADAGVLWTPVRSFTLGGAIMNVGAVSAFEAESDPLPMQAKFAIAWKGLESDFGQLIAAADLDWYLPPANMFNPSFGVEFWGGRYFALRAGYAVKQTDLSGLVGFAAGIGVRWETLRVDYAFAPFAALGTTHRISLNWEFWPLVSLPIPGSGVGEIRMVSPTGPLPPAPPYLQAEAGEGSVLLKWDAPQASSILGYNVYYRQAGPERSYSKYNNEPVTSTTIIVGGLDTNIRYFFVVKTVDASTPPRESVPSPEATTIPY